MTRLIIVFLLFSGLSCAPGMQNKTSVSEDSYAFAISGTYEGRLRSHSLDSANIQIKVVPISDSLIRIEPDESLATSSSFIVEIKGPSHTVLKMFYQGEQIGTIIAGVMKYRRSYGIDYSEYFSGSLLKDENQVKPSN